MKSAVFTSSGLSAYRNLKRAIVSSWPRIKALASSMIGDVFRVFVMYSSTVVMGSDSISASCCFKTKALAAPDRSINSVRRCTGSSGEVFQRDDPSQMAQAKAIIETNVPPMRFRRDSAADLTRPFCIIASDIARINASMLLNVCQRHSLPFGWFGNDPVPTRRIRYPLLVGLTYLDQNALIELGRRSRSEEFRKKLDASIETGVLTIVASVFHLVETAKTAKAQNALRLARFIDSLNPKWLRQDIRRVDICEGFYRFANVPYDLPQRITDRTTALRVSGGGVGKSDVSAEDFVRELMSKPQHLARLAIPVQNCTDALAGVRKKTRAGTLNPEAIRRADERVISAGMPNYTPSGLALGAEISAEYVNQVDVSSIPTVALERAISEHERARNDYADGNTLFDKFHLIYALPNVDELVSRDKFFKRIYPIAQSTGHARATLIDNDDFLKRFE